MAELSEAQLFWLEAQNILKYQLRQNKKDSAVSDRGVPLLWRWLWGAHDSWHLHTLSSPAPPVLPPGQKRLWQGDGVTESSGEEYLTAGPKFQSWSGVPGSVAEQRVDAWLPTGFQTRIKEKHLYMFSTYNQPTVNTTAPQVRSKFCQIHRSKPLHHTVVGPLDHLWRGGIPLLEKKDQYLCWVSFHHPTNFMLWNIFHDYRIWSICNLILIFIYFDLYLAQGANGFSKRSQQVDLSDWFKDIRLHF